MSALDQWGDTWSTCEAKTSEFITPPDGRYEVEVEDVRYEEVDDKMGGCYPQFTWVFRITQGEHEDSKFRKYTALRKHGNFEFLKGEMNLLNIPVNCHIRQLPNNLRMAIGSIIRVQVKSSNKTKQNGEPYKECYIQQIVKKSQWIVSGTFPPPQPQPQSQPQNGGWNNNNGWNGNNAQYGGQYYGVNNDDIPF